LAVGTSWLLLLLDLSGVSFNYVNLVAVPVVIGIGIDNGVHLVHRWQEEQNMERALAGVGRAVLMSSLTTMIGFGNIAFYNMPGMASMGVVLFSGVATCLLATLLVLPALASMVSRQAPALSPAPT